MRHLAVDTRFVAEALPVFISEAREQIDSVEQLMLQLEVTPDDPELLAALFRCVHTVKGSAGIFGLADVVAFAHEVESLLDLLRDRHLAFTPALGTLLLKCNDQIGALVSVAAGEKEESEDATAVRKGLIEQLHAAAGKTPGAEAAGGATAPDAEGLPWHIAVRFGSDTFRNGMDPLAILNYVGGMGRIEAVACDLQAVPPLDAIDPETCHLAFSISLRTDAARSEIESAFTFVREDCQLRVLGPDATPQDMAMLIDGMPDQPRLGELLLAAGAISHVQLRSALSQQAQVAASDAAPPPLGQILEQHSGLSQRVVQAALEKQSRQRRAAGPTAADDRRFIRVQADRLDSVINLLGELVIAAAGAQMLARQTRQRPLIEANSQIGRLIEDIRNGTLQLRMVPIGETFSRFRRIVRDTATELGKDVALEMIGGETELDKSVVERLTDPLMHLVRNALDHGLETPSQRLGIGKPAQGRLTLSAFHEAGGILIRIADDGRGIQRHKVLQRARERGLVRPGDEPDDQAVLNLIFEPGFSTAEQVTNLSGRGVGMDVVKRNIEALRGTVHLQSVEGQGSTIDIRLPLTLAIIDGFLVGVGTSRFIVPLECVVEVIAGRPAINRVDARGCAVVELRGQALPVVDLRQLYGLEPGLADRPSIVVLRVGQGRCGVLVDQLLGQHQTVIKPLGRMFRSLRGISGSSILGSGEVALIFDVHALGALAAGAAAPRSTPTARPSEVPDTTP